MGKYTFNGLCLEGGAFSSWLKPVAYNRYQAYCTLCKKALELSSLGIKSLQSHAKSEKHKVAVKGLQGVQAINQLCLAPSLTLPGPSTARNSVCLASSATQWFRINLHTESGDHVGVKYRDQTPVIQGERRYCQTFPSNVPRL